MKKYVSDSGYITHTQKQWTLVNEKHFIRKILGFTYVICKLLKALQIISQCFN